MQRLSGIATTTARYVAATGARRKMVGHAQDHPDCGCWRAGRAAWRRANHRFGLADGILIKDNHLAAIGGADRIAKAVRAARDHAPHTLRVEIEVATLGELDEAMDAGADIIMLDNMDSPTMREAVQRRDARGNRAILEASGGVTLERIPEIAATGVDLISVGALTHSAKALDISIDLTLHGA